MEETFRGGRRRSPAVSEHVIHLEQGNHLRNAVIGELIKTTGRVGFRFADNFQRLLLGLAISMGLWAMPASPQPSAAAKTAELAQRVTGNLKFFSFHQARTLLSDPYEFASTEARTLWEQIVRHSGGTSPDFGEMLKTGGEYAAIGDDCFLVLFAAIQFTCLGKDVVRDLTPWNPPGNTGVIAVQSLEEGRWWAVVATARLSQGVFSQSYHALVGDRRAGATDVKSTPLAASAFRDAEDGDECKAAVHSLPTMGTKILSFDVRSDRKGAFVDFQILRSDCRTGRTERINRRYRIPGTEDRSRQ